MKCYWFFIITLTLVFNLFSSSCRTDFQSKAYQLPDTLTIVHPEIILDQNADTISITDLLDVGVTSVFFLRHAEKEKNEKDPNLTATGQKRADLLKQFFKSVELSAIYSTNFRRTIQTATPTAKDQNLQILSYNHKTPEVFLNQILKEQAMNKILVVGHSNSTPTLINSLIGQEGFPQINEKEYDNLFLVNLDKDRQAEVIHLRLSL